MPLVPTVIVDGVKVCTLAREKFTTVPAFARTIGRHPGSLWNMRGGKKRVGLDFANQIAGGLGVPLSDITAPAEGEEQDEPAPAESAAAA